MAVIQGMMIGGNIHKEPLISPTLPSAATCSLPLYKLCLSGKRRQHGLKSAEGTVNEDHTNIIKDGDLLHGDYVYTD